LCKFISLNFIINSIFRKVFILSMSQEVVDICFKCFTTSAEQTVALQKNNLKKLSSSSNILCQTVRHSLLKLTKIATLSSLLALVIGGYTLQN